jgi:hypothetical protein
VTKGNLTLALQSLEHQLVHGVGGHGLGEVEEGISPELARDDGFGQGLDLVGLNFAQKSESGVFWTLSGRRMGVTGVFYLEGLFPSF